MSVEAAIVSLCENATSVDALIDGRIYAVGRLPQNAEFPAITYQIISAQRGYIQSGKSSGGTTYRVQLNLYAESVAALVALRDAIETDLSGIFNIDTGSPSVHVEGCFIVGEGEQYVSELDEVETLYRKSLDLALTVR